MLRGSKKIGSTRSLELMCCWSCVVRSALLLFLFDDDKEDKDKNGTSYLKNFCVVKLSSTLHYQNVVCSYNSIML